MDSETACNVFAIFLGNSREKLRKVRAGLINQRNSKRLAVLDLRLSVNLSSSFIHRRGPFCVLRYVNFFTAFL